MSVSLQLELKGYPARESQNGLTQLGISLPLQIDGRSRLRLELLDRRALELERWQGLFDDTKLLV